MLIAAMADDDHQKIIETVLDLVREQLRENGVLDFTVLTLDEQGREGRIDIDPGFLPSDATKDRLTRDLRRDFRPEGHHPLCARRRMLDGASEAIPLVPVRSENLEHYPRATLMTIAGTVIRHAKAAAVTRLS